MRRISSQRPVVEEAILQLTREYIKGPTNFAVERLRYDLVAFCLANWDFIQPHFDQQVNYCVAEAIPPLEFWNSKIIP